MQKRLFITGTDTDIGKTVAACLLLRDLMARGYTVAALKPVAAGAIQHQAEFINEDVMALANFCSRQYDYAMINPILLAEPLAPHIAAENQGEPLGVQRCVQLCRPMLDETVDYLVVEGAGGWLVPLNKDETMADLALAMECDIVLVVGMRLGCINHALLTAGAIRQSGARLLGWVANFLDPEMAEQQANLQAIARRLDAPLLAEVPHLPGGPGNAPENLFDASFL